MKIVIFAAGMLAANSAMAQTAPATNGIPNTTLSTAPVPSAGPRAQEGNMPANSATTATANTAAIDSTATTTTAVVAPDGSTAAVNVTQSANPPAPAAMDHYPVCKAGQFDHCMEPGNRHR